MNDYLRDAHISAKIASQGHLFHNTMSGKRHFSTKRTSLFGSENEKNSQLPDLSENFTSILTHSISLSLRINHL